MSAAESHSIKQIGLPGSLGDAQVRKHQTDVMGLSVCFPERRAGAAKAEAAFTEGDFCVIGVRTIGGQRTSISLSGSSLFNRTITSYKSNYPRREILPWNKQ